MGYHLASSTGTTIVNSTGSGGESAFMQVGPLSTPVDAGIIIVLYLFSYIATATTLNVRITLRRAAGVTGALLTTLSDFVATAGQLVERSGLFVDTPSTSGPQTYALNVNNITTGAAAAFVEQQLFAFVL